MTAIAVKQLVHAPLGSAARTIRSFAAAHPATVTLTPARRPGDMTPRFRMRWHAEGGGLQPSFDGELLVGADEDYNAFRLVLEGRYATTPSSAAEPRPETARALLVDMAREIEAQIGEEEATKLHAVLLRSC
jgi:hypothetical protein